MNAKSPLERYVISGLCDASIVKMLAVRSRSARTLTNEVIFQSNFAIFLIDFYDWAEAATWNESSA